MLTKTFSFWIFCIILFYGRDTVLAQNPFSSTEAYNLQSSPINLYNVSSDTKQQAQGIPTPEVEVSNVEVLLLDLQNEDSETRYKAFQALQVLGTEIAIPKLVEQFQHSDWQKRVIAAYTLGKFGADARAAIPVLSKAIEEETNPDVRFTVAGALGKIGTEEVLPALIKAIQDEDENVRYSAVKSLKQLGEIAKAAIPELIDALWDGNWFVRHTAIEILKQFSPDDLDIVKLVEAIEEVDTDIALRKYIRTFSKGCIDTIF